MSTIPAVRALLIDLSGTLHIGKDALPGAVQALERLRQAHIPVRFCSNTSKESTASLVKSLHKMGFDVREGEVFTSLGAAREVVRRQKLNPFFLISASAREEFVDYPESRNVYDHDAVVIGLAPEELSYERLNIAFRILTGERPNDTTACGKDRQHKTAPLIAMHKASYVRNPDGALSLGPGPFVTALESAANVKAHILGKPTRKQLILDINLGRSRGGFRAWVSGTVIQGAPYHTAFLSPWCRFVRQPPRRQQTTESDGTSVRTSACSTTSSTHNLAAQLTNQTISRTTPRPSQIYYYHEAYAERTSDKLKAKDTVAQSKA
ncbi:hypothetical protein FS749_014750 [Ceratobasidium sp. UAMH 11750]|nr:hypothetical protein FS749_014750 [Ceratobasidium sp. UAMH 11750]